MKYDTYKKSLETELARVESELKTVGHKNPKKPGGWEAETGDLDVDRADENEVADKIESFEENTVILEELEIQREEIKSALERIEKGAYGLCEVCGKKIEEERLEANPAATTCVEHMNK